MPEPIYQCCYTNATESVGDITTSGWRAVDVSPDIPANVYDTCVKLQNANSTLCASAVDEDGNVLALYELFGDGRYLYVIRTQYGLSDRLGRPNMFSHAIIFPFQDSIFLDPNLYLSLSPAAFKRTAGQPSWNGAPSYAAFTPLDTAMGYAGLDREKYAVLAKCIYAQMSASKGTDPLYIQYDGTERQFWSTLHCICAGIPHYMLKTLHAASCPTANDSGKHLVFSKNARSKERWLVPQTGENSILNPRIERKISRYGYIDYPMLHKSIGDISMFYLNLDSIAATLGGASGANRTTSKLAFYFWIGADESKFTDEELERNFSDALHLPLPGSISTEKVLERMLVQINRRNFRLTAENEALLDTWLSNAKSEGLQAAGRKYKTK